MIKSELVTRLQLKNPHLFQRDVEGVVNSFLDEIATAMRDRNRVELRGFGAFSVRIRDARVGRNPRTGEPVRVDEKAAPFFRAGKEMRDRINAAGVQTTGPVEEFDEDEDELAEPMQRRAAE